MQLRLDPNTEAFLDRLSETTRRMNRAQAQISSGKRFTSVSDAPDQVSTLLQTRLELENTVQAKQNLSRIKTEVDSAESALAAAAKLFEKARTLAAAGANSANTAEQYNQLAIQVEAVLERMIAAANTAVEGRYVFSGETDSVAPFAAPDFNSSPSYTSYQGSPTATRAALAADGSTFGIARTGRQIFENPDPGKNILGNLEALRAALRAGDYNAVSSAAAAVSAAEEHLRAEHAAYGAVQARVNDAIAAAAQQELRFRSQLGLLEDADMTTAIVEFQQAKMQREAALQAHAQMPRKSLFDYLG